MNVVISAIRLEAEDIISIELVPANGGPMPVFDAGSHIDIHLPEGIVRQYSIWNHPDETHRYCIGVLKDPASRGGSRAVHEQLRVGQIVQISEPRNLFPLDLSAKRSVLFAGGIGITPILSMAQRLAANDQDFEMHYCARAEEKPDRCGHGPRSCVAGWRDVELSFGRCTSRDEYPSFQTAITSEISEGNTERPHATMPVTIRSL